MVTSDTGRSTLVGVQVKRLIVLIEVNETVILIVL